MRTMSKKHVTHNMNTLFRVAKDEYFSGENVHTNTYQTNASKDIMCFVLCWCSSRNECGHDVGLDCKGEKECKIEVPTAFLKERVMDMEVVTVVKINREIVACGGLAVGELRS